MDDILGQKYGMLTVVSFSHKEANYRNRFGTYYNCICDCGNKCIMPRVFITSGYKSNLSKNCGCKPRKNRLGLNKTTAAFNTLIYTYRRNAELRNLTFELSYEKCMELFSSKCHYCNLEPYNLLKHGNVSQTKYNGIDRVANSIGYTPENVVPCCKICNLLKSNHDKEFFLNHIAMIYNHSIDE